MEKDLGKVDEMYRLGREDAYQILENVLCYLK